MDNIEVVLQDDECGCVPACLAMILGRTYEDVTKDFENDFSKKGVNISVAIEYLADHGCSVLGKSVEFYIHKDFAREELLRPFAPVHLVNVQHGVDSENKHAIVMDGNGKLICPGEMSDEELRKSYRIVEVFGIYKN